MFSVYAVDAYRTHAEYGTYTMEQARARANSSENVYYTWLAPEGFRSALDEPPPEKDAGQTLALLLDRITPTSAEFKRLAELHPPHESWWEEEFDPFL
jgi:hypothetical protein